MKDRAKTKARLIDELEELRQGLAQLEVEEAERRKADEALRASAARYRAVVESQSELICRYLPDGTITFANGAYCRYFSKTPSDFQRSQIRTVRTGSELWNE
jgi:two-component system cell cycle sensor histidine kinase/response regulator CckA